MKQPKWLVELMDPVYEALDIKGVTCRLTRPDNNSRVWHIEIAPSVMEISGGQDDGAIVYGHMDIDLLALPKVLDEVTHFKYHAEDDQCRPMLCLEGKKGRREFRITLYFEPFEDDEPHTIFEPGSGIYRDRYAEMN